MNFFQRLFNSKDNTNNTENKFDVTKKISEIKISDFESISKFWEKITQDDEWYIKYLPQNIIDLKEKQEELAPYIIESTNNLRYNQNFKKSYYWNIIQWDNLIFDLKLEDKLKQFCSNCNAEISIQQRYPKLICHNCKLKLTSSDNRNVEFFNSESLGYGCQGYYVGTNQNEKYESNEAYIDDKIFIAEEGRFGGIVIELKE